MMADKGYSPAGSTAHLGSSLQNSPPQTTRFDSSTTIGTPEAASRDDDEETAPGPDDEEDERNSSSALRTFLAGEVIREDVASERTPLLPASEEERKPHWLAQKSNGLMKSMRKITAADVVRECVQEPIKALPAVILGLLLNVLDGVSYGMIL